MNKLISKIVGVALGLTLAAGTGIAIIANNRTISKTDAASASFDFSTGTFANNTITWSDSHLTIFQEKVSGSTNPSESYISAPRWYSGNQVTFTPASGTTIDSVTIVTGSNSYGTTLNDGTWVNASHSVSGSTVTVSPTDGTSAFSVTLGGQSRISSLSYEYSAQSAATLTSIALSGSMSKTNYTTAEEWDPTGLVVTGTYSDSSSKNLTAGATFTYYNASNNLVATPNDLGVGSNQTLKVVASYTGVSNTAKYTASSSINVTKAIEYKLVTDVSKLTKNTTFILVGTGSYNSTTYTRAMTQERTTSNSASTVSTVTLSNEFNGNSVATSGGATVFTLDGSAGAWKIKNGDNQLGFTGTSNNNMRFNESQTDTFKITVASGYTLSIESNTHSGRKLQYNVNNGDPRFSNYNGGQSYVYMFANIAEVTYGETDHVTIGTMPETEFAVGETFNSTGLTLTAWDGADESTANSKNALVYHADYSGVTFTDSDIGQQTVTVTYTEDGNSFEVTYDIYVYAAATYELVTEAPAGGWAGSYLITSEVTTATTAIPATGTYAMKSTLDNFDVVGNYRAVEPQTDSGTGKTTIVAGQHLQFSIAAVSGGYSIQGLSGKYIGWNSASSNGLTSSNTALVNTIAYDTELEASTIICNAGTKGLTLNTSSGQFRYYSNATVQLYKLVESSEAVAYAAEFLEVLSSGQNAVCDNDGTTVLADLIAAWGTLAEDFADLSNADKQQFTQGAADESGNDINQALALYDYIAAKYNTQLETQTLADFDFMGRNIQPAQTSKTVNGVIGESTTAIALLVIISTISLTTIGGYFFLRKKKEQ